ncbi:ABC transporter ATP-binding protein [Promicromonospora kroppenstedtii]|uniref:ABC transporter ATP-binding protein n=1 Tax=Promicromonospora kroppenstedtii TaxID=440482 RepID=UPI0004B81214|nr:ABC transporter ATP-binding protein [Promicromonospora kroppenstedtii]
MSGPNVLEVRGLSARIAGQEVVHDVSFEVPASGVTAVLGRNGVGKTSTLRAILGLVERSGEVLLDGVRVDGERTDRIVRRGVGYVPEDREVFAGLTVSENLRLAERRAGSGGSRAARSGTTAHGTTPARRELVDALFPDLVKRAGQRAGTLSGGQQQMVSLARALLNDNRILLVDEPTKGLAPRIVTEVAETLATAARTVPVLLVEQNLQVVERLAERVVVIDAGRVVHTGPARELLDDPELVQRLLGVSAGSAGETGVAR